MFNLSQPQAHVTAKLELNGVKYELEKFKIGFSQPIDFKGQPQHEVKGGQFMITLSQAADDELYYWARRPTLLKDGHVVFQTDLGISALRIEFTNAYCVNLVRDINAMNGTTTTLMISPETIIIDGITHNNRWNK